MSSSEATLEDTPTWIVASVCSVIVLISFVFERALHRLGKALERRRRETLYEALLKLKEELMLLGFISLLLVVFQGSIQRICIDEAHMERWLPCHGPGGKNAATASSGAEHYGVAANATGGRRLLSGGAASGHCPKGKVPLLSLHALEQIHIFIFVLAITHVVLSAVTVLLGLLQMRKWSHWEKSIQAAAGGGSAPKMMNRVQKIKFIQNQCKGHERIARVRILMRSFFKQFYGSVTMDDYVAMRLGFVTEHFRMHTKFNFYNYMIRALEKDFKRVVGIKWYYWVFVMIYLLFNIIGWHSYFWISLVPLTLLLVIGTKLEHIINKLAYEIATKHAAAVEEGGGMVMSPSDELFWFRRPQLLLVLIHFILFQNAFEFAFFVWTLAMFGFKSCMMDRLGYSISRIVICVFVQVLCSYSTLPLYAIVTHMGSSFKSAVFAFDVAENLRGWADTARKRNRMAAAAAAGDVGCLGGAATAKPDKGAAARQLRSISMP